jgi:hypothetical protein
MRHEAGCFNASGITVHAEFFRRHTLKAILGLAGLYPDNSVEQVGINLLNLDHFHALISLQGLQVKARDALVAFLTHIRGFFARFFLNNEEFPRKEGFKAVAGSENSPKVKF